MKIAVINNLFKPFERGGAEKVAEFQAADLARLGHNVIVITSKPGLVTETADQLKTYRLGGFPATFSRLNKLSVMCRVPWHLVNIFNLGTAYRVYKLLRDEEVETVIGNNLFGLGLLVPVAARLAGAKYICVLHDIQLLHPSGLMYYQQETLINSWLAKAYQLITRFEFSFVSGVTAPSSWLLKLYLDHGFFIGAKARVIANPDTLPNLLTKISPTVPTFLYAAQLESHKGIDLLLSVFNDLPGAWRLEIMGDGSRAPIVEDKIAKNNKINYRPWQTDRLATLMSEADYLIVPSLCYENSPIAIKRAQAAGLNVLASNLGGIPEIISDERFLFAPTEAALKEKVLWAIENVTKLRQAKTIKAKQAVENYSEQLLTLC